MSTTAVRAEPPPQRASLAQSILAFPSRVVAVFSGPIGFALKIVLLAVSNAIAIWAGVILVGEQKWIAVAVLVATTLFIDWAYMSKRSLALKFLIPGTILLLAFQVIPILYLSLIHI